MIKKICVLLFFILTTTLVLPVSESEALSRAEKQSKCEVLKEKTKTTPQDTSLKNDIIPVDLLENFSNTMHNISNNLIPVQVLGDALMCHAVHGDPWEATVAGIHLFSWPNIPIWLCGAIIYCFGFILALSVAFYIVDVSFKLGFSIIVLPLAIALWPFAWTKDKLMTCISVFLKSAGILIFLSLTAAYVLNMFSTVLSGLNSVMDALTENKTAEVAETFSLTSEHFILIVVVLIYGMKLIGSTISDYVDKFFPDKTFGGGSKASPMHGLSTQAVDFAKQKAIAPATKFAHDVAKTQTGRLTSGAGKLMQGKYNKQIRNSLHQARLAAENPEESLKKLGNSIAEKAVNIGGAAHKKFNDLKYGAKSALGSAVLSGEGKEAFQKHVQEQKEAANQQVDSRMEGLNNQFQNNKDALDNQIAQNEASKDADPTGLRKLRKQTKAGIDKLSKTENKFVKGAMKGFKGIINASGKVLEKTGDAMQNNKSGLKDEPEQEDETEEQEE